MPWKEALPFIAKANAPLAQEIKKLNPSDDYTLVKVSYPWGQHILYEGLLYIPNDDGHLVTLNHSSINADLREKLDYNQTIPLGMVLNNSIELYIQANQRIMPFVYMPEGKIFALWISLQENRTSNHTGRVDNITAGSRSLMILPKISDFNSYKKIKKNFNLKTCVPNGISDQWNVLVELANHPSFPESWSVDVLYFTKPWLENKRDDNWRIFREYLLEVGWKSTDYLRNQIVLDVALSCALADKNLKPNPYLSDTVKHLFSMGQGIYPGFKIATNNESGPITGFQEIFSETYGLRYAPTIVVPGYLSENHLEPIYYSLEAPTLMEFSPKSRKANNKLRDLREIKHIMDSTINFIMEDTLRLKNSPLYQSAKNVIFEYYHSESDKHEEIKLTQEIPQKDNNLKKQLMITDKPFCESSTFLRGCVSLIKKIS